MGQGPLLLVRPGTVKHESSKSGLWPPSAGVSCVFGLKAAKNGFSAVALPQVQTKDAPNSFLPGFGIYAGDEESVTESGFTYGLG